MRVTFPISYNFALRYIGKRRISWAGIDLRLDKLKLPNCELVPIRKRGYKPVWRPHAKSISIFFTFAPKLGAGTGSAKWLQAMDEAALCEQDLWRGSLASADCWKDWISVQGSCGWGRLHSPSTAFHVLHFSWNIRSYLQAVLTFVSCTACAKSFIFWFYVFFDLLSSASLYVACFLIFCPFFLSLFSPLVSSCCLMYTLYYFTLSLRSFWLWRHVICNSSYWQRR